MEKDNKLVVAVVGSRSMTSCPALLARLAALAPDQVVSGGASGVDALAADWARANRVPLLELRPDYTTHGGAAPHVRNAEIVAAAGLVLVVWDGVSLPHRGLHAKRGAGGGTPGPALRVAGGPGTGRGASSRRAGTVKNSGHQARGPGRHHTLEAHGQGVWGLAVRPPNRPSAKRAM